MYGIPDMTTSTTSTGTGAESAGDGVAADADAGLEGRAADGELPDLTPGEVHRYSRHLRLPDVGRDGQRRLKASRVLVVGVGGLGSPAALYLAAAGVGRLGLVDHDRVEVTNLQRQILHDTRAVGEEKLASARRRLEATNPEVEVVTHEARLDSGNALEILDGYDLVVDGSDNFPTRYLVNDACVLSGVPLVYGAVHRFDGQASVFAADDGPCYRCLFRDPPPHGAVPTCEEAGVLGVLPGIIGSIQATEALKLLLGEGRSLSGRLLTLDAREMRFREIEVRRDADCPACGDDPSVTELIDYEEFCGMDPSGSQHSGEDGVPHVDVQTLRRRIEEGEPLQILDVRQPYEWEICNLDEQGADLVPLGQLPGALDRVRDDRPVVVYCRSGGRSARAVRLLQRHGYDAANLEGGILAWAQEIDPEMPEY